MNPSLLLWAAPLLLAQTPPLPSLAPLVDSVKGAVVNVDVKARARSGPHDELGDDFMERFFGRRGAPRDAQRDAPRVVSGEGSGFIIDPKGLVLTNNHVVEGALDIRLRLDDGRILDAKVIGRDPLLDLALLAAKGVTQPLPFVKLGDSDAVRVGDWVVAIGNPLNLNSSVSAGILSARARHIGVGNYDDFLQTDTAINLGNSGGPLFNLKGEVIGINTLISSVGTGIGFAIPSNQAKAVLPLLEKDGAVTRGWLGVGTQDLTPELGAALGLSATEGAIVTTVKEGTPAAEAGVHPDDVIVQMDGDRLASAGALRRGVALRRPGTVANLVLFRGGKRLELKVKLGTRRPEEDGLSTDHPTEPDGPRGLGLEFKDFDKGMQQRLARRAGAVITEVTPGSPAERADLSHGMVILEAGGKPVKNAQDLHAVLDHAKSGSSVLLRVFLIEGGRELRALTVP